MRSVLLNNFFKISSAFQKRLNIFAYQKSLFFLNDSSTSEYQIYKGDSVEVDKKDNSTNQLQISSESKNSRCATHIYIHIPQKAETVLSAVIYNKLNNASILIGSHL